MTDVELYTKHPHILAGSIGAYDRGKLIVAGKKSRFKSHGRVCIIACANAENSDISCCLKTRMINVQDVTQVKFCTACTKHNRNSRRRVRRKEMKSQV